MISIECVAPCTTCTSASTCLTCDVNYYYNTTADACISCPAGTYSAGGTVTSCTSTILYPSFLNIISLDCSSPCATCKSASFCLSCPANYSFDSVAGTCTACPSGKFSSGGIVTTCISNIYEDSKTLFLLSGLIIIQQNVWNHAPLVLPLMLVPPQFQIIISKSPLAHFKIAFLEVTQQVV